MRSGRIHRWEERVQGSMRPIVRFRSGLRPSLHRTMEVKTQNQISHDSWYKERCHSIQAIFLKEIVFCNKQKNNMSIKEAIDPLNISGSNVRDLLLKGKIIPRHIMRSPIQKMLYSELANGKQLFYE